MTKSKYKPKHSWYEADMRRRAIAKAKFQKHREYEAEMAEVAKRMDEQREQSAAPSVL